MPFLPARTRRSLAHQQSHDFISFHDFNHITSHGDRTPPAPGSPIARRSFLLEALPRRIAMHLPEAARHVLVEGAGAGAGAPRASAQQRLRKGAFKAMLAQVGAEGGGGQARGCEAGV